MPRFLFLRTNNKEHTTQEKHLFIAFVLCTLFCVLAMRKSDKQTVVENLAQQIKDAKSVTVLDYQKMGTKQLNQLRQQVKKAGGSFVVAKNTLIKLALEKASFARLKTQTDEKLEGPTALIFAQGDEIAPLQVVGKSISESDLPKLKFGIFDSAVLEADKLIALSRLPGKNILFGKLVGVLASPSYSLVGTLNGNLQKLVYILSKRQKALNQ